MKLRSVWAGVVAFAALMALPSWGWAEGVLKAQTAEGVERGMFPLTRTNVSATISGPVTEVSVQQRFHNPYTDRIEAVYVLPLPDDAAVEELTMRFGTRTVRAEVQRLTEAREHYNTARATGHRAALLEQERPNIYTLSVAGIDPGTDVDVSLRYVALAHQDHGAYEMVFPMVVGPRYIPGDPVNRAPVGTGTHADTDRVPDASRISPIYAVPGMRVGHAIGLSVHLDAGSPLASIESPAHDVTVQREGAVADVALVDKDEIPNRDFILRWTVQANGLQAAVIPTRAVATGDGYVAVMLQPRRDPPPDEIAPRELVFLLDTSGSMQGPPLATARAAVERALEGVSPADTFSLIDFADTASAFAPRPLPGTPENVANARAYLEHLSASGGTNQLVGIHAALSMPGDPMRLRYVMFLTDGYIGNETEILALTHREVGSARIFSLGIGGSVNRYLLDEVAAAGRGVAEYLRPDEDPGALVERFYTRIGQPWLTDISLDWGNLSVHDVEPSTPADLSALQPLLVLARYTAPGSGALTIRGRVGGRDFLQVVPVTLPTTEAGHDAIGNVWARARITDLTRKEHIDGASAETTEGITHLALAHHLMSQYTSLVAIDATAMVGGRTRTVVQPIDGPEGVNLHAAGGVSVGRHGGSAGGMAAGMGYGGGGLGVGTVGLGRIGTVGHGWGSVGHTIARGDVGGMDVPTVLPQPTVLPSSGTVLGSLDTTAIRRVMNAHLGAMERCYERGLAAMPGLHGALALRFTIALDGSVSSAMVIPPGLSLDSVNACLATVVSAMSFPAPGGSTVTVTYPFNFTPPATPGSH